MGLFGLFGRKKEVELDDNITEGILQFENLNLKLAVIQVLMYDLGQFTRNYTQTTKRGLLTTNKG